MENLNFIDPLLHGIVPEALENKTLNLSVKQLACAGVSTLVIGAVLKKAGQNKTGAFVASLALPLLASAFYKKYKNRISDTSQDIHHSGIEYNH
ncbi:MULTISPECIES: PrgI family protein [unclassified Flavobacterium]|uniref:PrgI family protein n=1 Tax=unclassified Flavobacterium TaxID=196869 RepID=UPI000493287D|nr:MULTISPECIES: PrgI family protein [unclassified Flavobacterium]MBF4494142.1 PrgI family protein [Flavobacterium sp. MR2016-29]